jgi:hypothetical protein
MDKNGKIRADAVGKDKVELNFSDVFNDEDVIRVETDVFPIGLGVRVDRRIPESQIWLTENYMEFPIHLDELGKAYPEDAFIGTEHYLSATVTGSGFFGKYRNLSVNPLDKHEETTYYPHCTATHESDNHDPRFTARNAIDGVIVPYGHWGWPYTSWGNDRNLNAEIKIEFGRSVLTDKTVIHLRADFPHDNWWKEATMEFSDGSREKLNLLKTGDAQILSFTPRKITWAKLVNFIQCDDDPSPFPALTQWAIYGKDF